MLLMGDYGRWQDLLKEEFLSVPYRPVIFFVDERVLGDIAAGMRDPVGNLSRAVSTYCDLADPEPFKTLEELVKRWKRGPRTAPPPVLPVLVLSVLAASQMQSADGVKVSNYYFRLVKLLSPDTFNHKLLANRLASSENLVRFWQELHGWIQDQQGAVGRSTIRTLETRRKIGYPILQALIRAADRAALFDFFHGVKGLGHQLTKESLFVLFATWSVRERKVSDHLLTFIHDPIYQDALAEVLLVLAQDWIESRRKNLEEQPSSVPPGAGTAQLSIDLGKNTLKLFVNSSTPRESFILTGNFHSWKTDIFFERTTAKGQRFYGLVEPAPPLRELRGATLSGHDFRWMIPQDKLWVFEKVNGHLVSRHSMKVNTEYWLVPHEDAIGGITQFFQEHSQQYELVSLDAQQQKIFGLKQLILIYNFRDDEVVKELIAAFASHVRHSITSEESVPVPQLVNGLRVFTGLITSTYMAGGEPDILLPQTLSDQRRIGIKINGKTRAGYPHNSRIRLRDFGLAPGHHEISLKSTHLNFSTIAANVKQISGDKDPGMFLAREQDPLVFPRERMKYLWFCDDGKTREIKVSQQGRLMVSLGPGLVIEAPLVDVPWHPNASFVAARINLLHWELWDLSAPASPPRVFKGIDMAYEWRRTHGDTHDVEAWIALYESGEG